MGHHSPETAAVVPRQEREMNRPDSGPQEVPREGKGTADTGL